MDFEIWHCLLVWVCGGVVEEVLSDTVLCLYTVKAVYSGHCVWQPPPYYLKVMVFTDRIGHLLNCLSLHICPSSLPPPTFSYLLVLPS